MSQDEELVSELHNLSELHEIGWLVDETDTTISLAMEQPGETKKCRLWLTIPKSTIIKTLKLEWKDILAWSKRKEKRDAKSVRGEVEAGGGEEVQGHQGPEGTRTEN